MYTKINDLNNWGLEFTKRLIRNKGNIFWNDVLNSWIEICNNEQTVEILIRQRALLHLIWVQTVCLCPPPPQKKKDAICAYGLVIRYDLHNYGKTTYGQIFHTIMSWLMTACVRSPVCLACAWILACQASVGTDVDGKSCFLDANW